MLTPPTERERGDVREVECSHHYTYTLHPAMLVQWLVLVLASRRPWSVCACVCNTGHCNHAHVVHMLVLVVEGVHHEERYSYQLRIGATRLLPVLRGMHSSYGENTQCVDGASGWYSE